jgi:putative transcriptional regulator
LTKALASRRHSIFSRRSRADLGPRSAILALGYAGWAPGQLENEIQHNGWLHCAADPDLIFGADTGRKYVNALKKIGIDLGMLSSEAGHA